MVAATTSCPSSSSKAAATDESTPPESPTSTRTPQVSQSTGAPGAAAPRLGKASSTASISAVVVAWPRKAARGAWLPRSSGPSPAGHDSAGWHRSHTPIRPTRRLRARREPRAAPQLRPPRCRDCRWRRCGRPVARPRARPEPPPRSLRPAASKTPERASAPSRGRARWPRPPPPWRQCRPGSACRPSFTLLRAATQIGRSGDARSRATRAPHLSGLRTYEH